MMPSKRSFYLFAICHSFEKKRMYRFELQIVIFDRIAKIRIFYFSMIFNFFFFRCFQFKSLLFINKTYRWQLKSILSHTGNVNLVVQIQQQFQGNFYHNVFILNTKNIFGISKLITFHNTIFSIYKFEVICFQIQLNKEKIKRINEK